MKKVILFLILLSFAISIYAITLSTGMGVLNNPNETANFTIELSISKVVIDNAVISFNAIEDFKYSTSTIISNKTFLIGVGMIKDDGIIAIELGVGNTYLHNYHPIIGLNIISNGINFYFSTKILSDIIYTDNIYKLTMPTVMITVGINNHF